LRVNTYTTNIDLMFDYAWGEDILKVNAKGKPIDTIHFEDRYNLHAFNLLAEFAIGELAKDFDEAKNAILEVMVVAGVPTNDFNEESVKDLINVLNGDHNVVVNDESLNIRVKEVKIIPQPVGTVYNEVLNNEGYIKQDSYLDEHITIVDIGGGTILIDTLLNMNLSDSGRTQEKYGAYKIYEMVENNCIENNIRGASSSDIEKIIRHSNGDQYYFQPNKNESFDITKYVKKAKTKYTRNIINMINTTLKETSNIDTFLFTGGGANLIDREEILNTYKHATFINNSETANVHGFYKFGVASQLEEAGA